MLQPKHSVFRVVPVNLGLHHAVQFELMLEAFVGIGWSVELLQHAEGGGAVELEMMHEESHDDGC